MFKLNIYNQFSHCLADLLPWVALVAPGVVLNKDGSLQRTCRFRGPDMESGTDEQLAVLMAKLNNALKRLGAGWSLYVEAKREAIICERPCADFPDPVSLLIDIEHHNRFFDQQQNFITQYYMTWQYLPPTQIQQSLWRQFIKQAKIQSQEDEISLARFIEQTKQSFNLLKELCFEADFLNDTETLTYLHSTISEKQQVVSPPKTPIYLDALLADSPLLAGMEPKLGQHYIKVVTIIGFPESTIPSLLEQLNHLAIPYRWMTRFIALGRLEAEQLLKRQRQRWFAKRKSVANLLQEVFTKQESSLQDNAAVEKAREVDEALQLLATEQVSYGYYTCTVVLTNKEAELARQYQEEVERVIHALGLTCIAEGINAVEAWLSSIPGQAYANVRRPILHSMNLSHLIPFSSIWSGQRFDQHLNASPLFYAYTYGATPFSFVLHHQDIGHHLLIGPTGAGKSVFLNFLACQFRRYKNARVIIFEKGKSFLTLSKALSGNFYELGKDGLHFQPLANIHDENELQWALQWLTGLLEHAHIVVTSEVKNELWQALQSLQTTSVEHRTLFAYSMLLQNSDLREAIQRYTIQSGNSILDASEDNLLDGSWLCFEMEALMNGSYMLMPVLTYLFHRLEKSFLGEPTLLILDEAWLFLDHGYFAQQIKDWLKSLRKKNVSVIFATQSVSDAVKHSIAATLLESCPGRILLPNSRANEPQIKADYLQIGLNERQIELLSAAQAKKHYYYQSRLGNRLFSLELGKIAVTLCGSSSQDDIAFVKQHEQSKLMDFLKAFFKYKKMEWVLEILSEVKYDSND